MIFRIYTVQEIADLYNLKYNTLRQTINRELKKQNSVLTLDNKIFIVTKTSKKICLIPVDAEPIDINELENKTAVLILEKLLPCLCSRCSDSVQQIKEIYEGN